MEVPTPPEALAALAKFVRSRLSEVQDTLAPLWPASSRSVERATPAVRSTARQIASVIVSAAAPFAPNSYARTRLIRQMHARGLLTEAESRQAETLVQD